MLTVIILTKNEGLHLSRCLESVIHIADFVLVVDSFSTDSTGEIARSFKAKFIENDFINHAQQFNFALTQVPVETKWVLRLDADEYLTPRLCNSIMRALDAKSKFNGFTLKRRIMFCGKLIRFGGIFPVEILRLFRYGEGVCEDRWMDEHIIVKGPVSRLQGELIDDNLNNLTWWIQKHNLYSNREALEILMRRYATVPVKPKIAGFAGVKRFIKEYIYSRLPTLPKVTAYFLYRYIIRAGFLDGREGFAFHFLQGFWYRYLVEAKVDEVEHHLKYKCVDFREAVQQILQIKL